jgi:SAM-dependent methyltransferase
MNWIIKAVVQKCVSALPYRERINYFLQSHIFKSLPAPEIEIMVKARQAVRQMEKVKKYGNIAAIDKLTCYEIGAGWDLTMPMVFHMLGVRKQVLLDYAAHVRPYIVNNTLSILERRKLDLQALTPSELKDISPLEIKRIADLADFDIDYRAPGNAGRTGLKTASVDFISSNYTLEYIPEKYLPAIFQECYRILKPEGCCAFYVNTVDQYSKIDKTLFRFNFLKYSDFTWSLVNSALHYTNRLRYTDYLMHFTNAGFEVVRADLHESDLADLETLKKMKLAKKFRDMQLKDIGVISFWILLKKAIP